MPVSRPILLDACCLINLHATGRLGDILRSLNAPSLVTETVRAVEVVRADALDALNPPGERLADLIRTGLLAVVDFESDEEAGRFLDFAAQIGGDGEAASLALASSRGYAVATDDRRARGFAKREVPNVPLVYSLEIVRTWSERRGVPADALREALESLREHGSYVPGRAHPEYEWWARALRP